MSRVLVDSDVLLDVATGEPSSAGRSEATLRRLADEAPLVINPLVYAEVSAGFERVEDLEAALPRDLFVREPLPYEAAFLAGRRFRAYRRRGGTRRAPLPDVYIGAHAVVAGYRLLTLDVARYRAYFPGLVVLAPDLR